MKITQDILDDLTAKAKESPRLRMNLDLRMLCDAPAQNQNYSELEKCPMWGMWENERGISGYGSLNGLADEAVPLCGLEEGR